MGYAWNNSEGATHGGLRQHRWLAFGQDSGESRDTWRFAKEDLSVKELCVEKISRVATPAFRAVTDVSFKRDCEKNGLRVEKCNFFPFSLRRVHVGWRLTEKDDGMERRQQRRRRDSTSFQG